MTAEQRARRLLEERGWFAPDGFGKIVTIPEVIAAIMQAEADAIERAAVVAEDRYKALFGPEIWQAAGEEIAADIRNLNKEQ